MNEEPTSEEIQPDDHQPATKGDVRRSQEQLAEIVDGTITREVQSLRSQMATKADIKEVRSDMVSKSDLHEVEQSLRSEMATKDDTKGLRSELKDMEQRQDAKFDAINRRLDDLVTIMDERVTRLENKATFRQ